MPTTTTRSRKPNPRPKATTTKVKAPVKTINLIKPWKKPTVINLDDAWERREELAKKIFRPGQFVCGTWKERFQYAMTHNNKEFFMTIILHKLDWLVENKCMCHDYIKTVGCFQVTKYDASYPFAAWNYAKADPKKHLVPTTSVLLKKAFEGARRWIMNQQGELVKPVKC